MIHEAVTQATHINALSVARSAAVVLGATLAGCRHDNAREAEYIQQSRLETVSRETHSVNGVLAVRDGITGKMVYAFVGPEGTYLSDSARTAFKDNCGGNHVYEDGLSNRSSILIEKAVDDAVLYTTATHSIGRCGR